jgi:hypothetical protein
MPKRTSTRPRSLLAIPALAAVALTALIAAPSAFALGFTGLSAAPTDTQAGANSDFNIHIGFTGAADDVENVRISLPPGLVGNPNAAPQCTVAQLEGPGCPANTQVGTVQTGVALLGLVPQTVSGGLYNLTPQPGEPARFGIRLNALPLPLPLDPVLPPIIMQSAVELRSADFGLDTVINDIPNTATVLGLPTPIDVTSMDVGLLGEVGGAGFLRNPTRCQEVAVGFTADSYTGSTAEAPITGQAPPFTPTGCDQLDFSPEFSATVGGAGMTTQGALTSVATAIDQGATEAGLRRAEVLTPVDFGANIDRIDDVCQPAAFQAGACPAASVVGNAIATSPLLADALTGPVVLVDTDELPLIGLDLRGQLNLKLTGTLAIDNRVTFDGLPDIPISHFELQFSGGPGGLLFANRDLCTPPAPHFTGSFQSHAGEDRAFGRDAVVQGCGQAAAPSKNATAKKCKKAKKRKKARKGEAATAKKKVKKRCKKKRKKRPKR